ncbi:MAG: hypothetical protein DRP79_00515 [Planctomycetota bacterium]|nr:MAG: hypothetical protein DRP79_00515 [Planctomycetota bacterium]
MIAPNTPAPETRYCKFHPEQPAEVRCKTCGAYLCYDCKYFYYGEYYCGDCFVRLRSDEARGDWIYPMAGRAVVAVSALLGIITVLGITGTPRLQTADADAVIMSVVGLALWHLADVVLFICGIGAVTFKRWARKGLIYGGVLGILRGAVWPVVLFLTVKTPNMLLVVFYAFVALYGLSVVLFYAHKRLRDEFRAIRP